MVWSSGDVRFKNADTCSGDQPMLSFSITTARKAGKRSILLRHCRCFETLNAALWAATAEYVPDGLQCAASSRETADRGRWRTPAISLGETWDATSTQMISRSVAVRRVYDMGQQICRFLTDRFVALDSWTQQASMFKVQSSRSKAYGL